LMLAIAAWIAKQEPRTDLRAHESWHAARQHAGERSAAGRLRFSAATRRRNCGSRVSPGGQSPGSWMWPKRRFGVR
jgi:hypothetical protein